MIEVVPISLAEANEFVSVHHRHRGRVAGHKFSIAAAVNGVVVGCSIVGRPVARNLDDGFTLEVNRLVTDGTPNACSKLYASSWRAARALGYRKLITYTLSDEPGTSLRAVGWKVVGRVTARSWSCPSRPRVDLYPLQEKIRWEATQ